jgi:hypothetical protein
MEVKASSDLRAGAAKTCRIAVVLAIEEFVSADKRPLMDKKTPTQSLREPLASQAWQTL